MSKKWEMNDILEFVKENSNATLLSKEYKNNKQRLEFVCECGKYFTKSLKEFVHENKRKCPDCMCNIMNESRRINDFDVTNRLNKLGYSSYAKYNGTESKMILIDEEGYRYYSSLHSVESHGIGKFDKSNPFTLDNIELWLFRNNKEFSLHTDTYISATDKLECICHKCNLIWNTSWACISLGHGCPDCAIISGHDKQRYTHDYFLDIVRGYNPNIEILGEYIDSLTRVKCRCNIDGYEWSPTAAKLLKGCGCPKCIGRYMTNDDFLLQMKSVSPDIDILSKYISKKDKVTCVCKKGHIWSTFPDGLLNGTGCPKCKKSKGERKIENILEINKISFTSQFSIKNCRDKKTLPFDIAIFEDEEKIKLQCLIEYDGEAHYFPVRFKGMKENTAEENFRVQGKRDGIKDEYCKINNIKLIRIPYWEFKNIKTILIQELKLA